MQNQPTLTARNVVAAITQAIRVDLLRADLLRLRGKGFYQLSKLFQLDYGTFVSADEGTSVTKAIASAQGILPLAEAINYRP